MTSTIIKNKIIMNSVGFSLGLSIYDLFFIFNDLFVNFILFSFLVFLFWKFDSYEDHEIESSCSSFSLFFILGLLTRATLFVYFYIQS